MVITLNAKQINSHDLLVKLTLRCLEDLIISPAPPALAYTSRIAFDLAEHLQIQCTCGCNAPIHWCLKVPQIPNSRVLALVLWYSFLKWNSSFDYGHIMLAFIESNNIRDGRNPHLVLCKLNFPDGESDVGQFIHIYIYSFIYIMFIYIPEQFIYIHIYMYVSIYVCICTHTYTHRDICRPFSWKFLFDRFK